MRRGCFITLEGVDGAGKTTHLSAIIEILKDSGIPVLATREPGGTALGEEIRTLLLSRSMGPHSEALLMFAARCEHVRQVIQPALEQGSWVVCDRYTDASYAYQGGGRRLGAAAIASLERWGGGIPRPDRTLLFDVPLATARARMAADREQDRFEREGEAFFERTREAYLERARSFPERITVIDSSLAISEIHAQIEKEMAIMAAGWRAKQADDG